MKVCKERQAALNLTLERILDEAKDALDLAYSSGSIPAAVRYANEINAIEDIISGYVEMYTDCPDLMDCSEVDELIESIKANEFKDVELMSRDKMSDLIRKIADENETFEETIFSLGEQVLIESYCY